LKSGYLNIASICEGTCNLGPGKRFVIWVQGCPFNCKNCISPDWKPQVQANLVNTSMLADILIDAEEFSGITISGGEPMLQAEELSKLCSSIKKQRPDLNIILYTGYKLSRLNSEHQLELLNYIDVIITGLYVDHLNDNKGLRGSSNQEVIFLTDALKDYEDIFINSPRKMEFHVKENEVLMVGLAPKGTDLELLKNNIKSV